jgi:hypothetical protein
LVADTLEQRWNEKLAKVAELSGVLEVERTKHHTLTAADRQAILGLGRRFGEVWNDPRCDSRLKKRLIRAVIKEIIVDIDDAQQQLKFVVHWHGGVHTQLMLPRPLSAAKAHKTAEEDSALIERLAVRYSDAEIARVLSKQGRKTGKGNRWTQTSVALVRRKLGIKPAPPRDPNLLNLLQAQRYLDVSDSTLLKLIEHQVLRATQLAPSAPFEINKADLDGEPVAGIIKGLKTTGRLILKGNPLDNKTDLFS